MDRQKTVKAIENGNTILGIELGSTRIKGVLIDENHSPIAAGEYAWESSCEDGIWTYSLDAVWQGLQACYRSLADAVQTRYQVVLRRIGAMGISGMMHGYLAFDESGDQLTAFRTWRNTMTQRAAEALTALFSFNIPQRWSIAHLYQAMLEHEPHVQNVAYLTTLAGYIHWQLTGRKVIGIGDASGMFPIDSVTGDYSRRMLAQFQNRAEQMGYFWKIASILPRVLSAGEAAGTLTKRGAQLLDPTGQLQAGVPLCPPEGDAGTGMTATNSVSVHTGNVSAGTSIFSMVVLNQPLGAVYPQIDMVTTPDGAPVAMVHCNTCTSELDAWVGLFLELLAASGSAMDKAELYTMLYTMALREDADPSGMVSYNCYAGEPVVELDAGCPMFARLPDTQLGLAGFMRAQLFSAMAALRVGMDILFDKERVHLDYLVGHGGLFKTKGVGQRIMASALNVPVCVLDTAGEGGAWGIALLAAYMKNRTANEPLAAYLSERVFGTGSAASEQPDEALRGSFDQFLQCYRACLPAEREAAHALRKTAGKQPYKNRRRKIR